MSLPKNLLMVRGGIFNVSDNISLGELIPNWKWTHEIETERLQQADRISRKPVPVGTSTMLDVQVKEFTPAWLARMLGATAGTGLKKRITETLTKATNDVTLTYGAGGTQSLIGIERVYDVVNKTYRYKAGAAVAGDAYTLAGKVLSMHASDTGTIFEVTYTYGDTASGTKVTAPVLGLPSVCRLVLAYAMIPPGGGTVNQYLVIDAAKCQPVGKIEIGGDAKSLVNIPLQFEVYNEAAGDIEYFFDTVNPPW